MFNAVRWTLSPAAGGRVLGALPGTLFSPEQKRSPLGAGRPSSLTFHLPGFGSADGDEVFAGPGPAGREQAWTVRGLDSELGEGTGGRWAPGPGTAGAGASQFKTDGHRVSVRQPCTFGRSDLTPSAH